MYVENNGKYNNLSNNSSVYCFRAVIRNKKVFTGSPLCRQNQSIRLAYSTSTLEATSVQQVFVVRARGDSSPIGRRSKSAVAIGALEL